MRKTLSVLGLAAAVLVVALALSSGYADKALSRSTCPSGAQKFVRVCIEKEARSEADFRTASADCADERRRLPTGAELDAFRQQDGIVLSGNEWTGDIIDQTTTLVMNDQGTYNPGLHSVSLPFRCVK